MSQNVDGVGQCNHQNERRDNIRYDFHAFPAKDEKPQGPDHTDNHSDQRQKDAPERAEGQRECQDDQSQDQRDESPLIRHHHGRQNRHQDRKPGYIQFDAVGLFLICEIQNLSDQISSFLRKVVFGSFQFDQQECTSVIP